MLSRRPAGIVAEHAAALAAALRRLAVDPDLWHQLAASLRCAVEEAHEAEACIDRLAAALGRIREHATGRRVLAL
jgi:glycosyltransferase involved in cell wall biosynthesis